MIKKFIGALVLIPMLVAGCAKDTAVPGLSPQASIGTTTNSAVPPLEDKNSTIDCSGWEADAKTILREQGSITINKQAFQVATFACGSTDSELSTEFVESFVFAKSVWASNGLVSGTDQPFITTGPCESLQTQIECPVKVLSATVETDPAGTLVIFEQDGGLAWRVDLN